MGGIACMGSRPILGHRGWRRRKHFSPFSIVSSGMKGQEPPWNQTTQQSKANAAFSAGQPRCSSGVEPPHRQPRLKHPAVEEKAGILLQAHSKRWTSPNGISTAPFPFPFLFLSLPSGIELNPNHFCLCDFTVFMWEGSTLVTRSIIMCLYYQQ